QNLITASTDQLISSLGSDNLVVRLASADQLVERIGSDAIGPVEALVNDKSVDGKTYIHALWVLHRLGALSNDRIHRSATHNDPLVRLHTMRILLEMDLDSGSHFDLVTKRLSDPDPHVKRAATELLVKFPQMSGLEQA